MAELSDAMLGLNVDAPAPEGAGAGDLESRTEGDVPMSSSPPTAPAGKVAAVAEVSVPTATSGVSVAASTSLRLR